MEDDALKVCPFCKERIRNEAVKCRYCGEWLERPSAETATQKQEAQTGAEPIVIPSTEQSPKILAGADDLSAEVSLQDYCSKGQARTGLKWMNGIFLVLYGYGFGANIFDSNISSKNSRFVFAIAVVGSVLVAASLFGFLAARNPMHETRRKLAKWSNAIAIALALFTFLRFAMTGGTTHARSGFVGPAVVYGFILSAILALPALINLRTFWKKPPIVGPPTNLDGQAQNCEPANTECAQAVIGQPEMVPAEPTEHDHEVAPTSTPQEEKSGDGGDEIVPPTVPMKRCNYFLRHWRGELSLGVSYWLNGLLATFLVLLAANTLVAMQDSVSLQLVAALSLFVYATAIVALVWQCVGVWRSASNHVSRGGKNVWATLAKVAVILGVLNCIVLVCNTYIPQSVEMVRIITGDKQLPAYEIKVLPGGTEIEFSGGIRAGCAKELERVLSAVPQAKVLHIESLGGRISEARRMIQLVRERGLSTYTAQCCLSAATLVLMSGKERVVAAGARVGFHAGTVPGATAEQRREMDNLVSSTMHSSGASEEFISRVLATPFEQMWYPSVAEMVRDGVVTSQTYGERFATSWGLSDAKLDAAIQSISGYPCFTAIRELEPEAYRRMMSNFVSAIRAGKSEGEAVAVISESAGSLMEKYLPAASDDALLSLREQWVEILSKYKDTNSRACIGVFTQAKINYSRAFPDWNMTNTLRVVEKVMRSGASRVIVPVDKKAADEDFNVVFNPMADKYKADLLLLQRQAEWMDNSEKVCDMLLTMYQQIATLPDKREANLIRSLVTNRNE